MKLFEARLNEKNYFISFAAAISVLIYINLSHQLILAFVVIAQGLKDGEI